MRNYDLASQERIVRGRMPTMEIINERFARNIRIGLFNFIRKSPEVSVGGIKVQKYSAFLREIVVPTNFNIVAVKPLRGSGLIVCDPSVVFAVIDALFGGAGKFHTRIEGRDFSPTEQRVILRLVETIMRRVQEGLARHLPAGAGVPALGDAAAVRQHRHAQRDRGGHQLHAGDRRDLGCDPLLHSVLDAGADPRRAVQHHPGRLGRAGPALGQPAEAADPVRRGGPGGRAGLTQATVEQLLAFKPGDFIELDLQPVIQAKVDGVPVFRLPLRHLQRPLRDQDRTN
jgi:flagellar motor switch protein FliM